MKIKMNVGDLLQLKLKRGEGKVTLLNRVTDLKGRELSWDARVITGGFSCRVGGSSRRKPGDIVCFNRGEML